MSYWKKSMGLRGNLQAKMPEMVAAWFADGRSALAEGVSWEHMHQFRLRTKRFRYSLELLRPAYGPGLDRKIKSLKKLQDYLGEINDAVATEELIRDLPDVQDAREELQTKAAKLRKKLREHWLENFEPEREEQRWIRYLRQYAARAAAPHQHLLAAPASEQPLISGS